MSKQVWIGIDPGQKGAISFISEVRDHQFVRINDMPLLPNGEVDAPALEKMIDGYCSVDSHVTCALERSQPMPSQSAQSGFNYGVGYGAVKAVLHLMGVPFQEIPPIKWKKSFSLPKIEKGSAGKKKGKQEAITKCLELFPDVPRDKYYGPKGGMKDGRAESLLLAEYARRSL